MSKPDRDAPRWIHVRDLLEVLRELTPNGRNPFSQQERWRLVPEIHLLDYAVGHHHALALGFDLNRRARGSLAK